MSPESQPKFAKVVITSALLALVAGCSQKRGEKVPVREDGSWEVRRPKPTTSRARQQSIGVVAQPAMVKNGMPPLVYMVETPMTVSVVDLATSRRLAHGHVPARTIIRVESRNGIFFGTEQQAAGPLPENHRFAIYLEAEDPNVIRSETIQPDRTKRGN